MTTEQKTSYWIQTLSGRVFDFENLDSNVFDPEEVATVLSRTPRFAGHTKWFYSVAQHCVLVSRQFDDPHHNAHAFYRKLTLAALLHDATEAFIGDVSALLKNLLLSKGNEELDDLEHRIWQWIADQHEFSSMIYHEIKPRDRAALATEARDLLLPPPQPWIELPSPWPERIEPWSQEYARDEWLRVYRELTESK